MDELFEIIAIFSPFLFIPALICYFYSIKMFIAVVDSKGFDGVSKGALWALGIFMTPLIVGLFAAALPDKKARNS